MNKLKNFDINNLIGKCIEEVRNELKDSDISFRIVRNDDKFYMITCDFRFDRINIEIDDNKITKVDIG